MKYVTHSLLILVLAAMPWGCSRDNTVDLTTTDKAAAPANAPSEDTASSQPGQERNTPKSTDNRKTPSQPAAAPAAPAAPASTAPGRDESARVDRVEPGAPVTTPAPAPSAPAAPAVPMATVPAGTAMTVIMLDAVSTAKNQEGDTFVATVAEPWSVDGKIVAERGDMVTGRVQSVVRPGKVKGRAELALVLKQISVGNRKYPINTEPFVATAADNKNRDAAVVAGGAGIGAAIGAIAGGKKGAAIGAILGGGGGTTAVLATPGQDMKIEPETKVNFVLKEPIKLPVIRNAS